MREIPEVMDIDIAFGNTEHMPPMEEIPKEFHMGQDNKWIKLFNQLFYYGGEGVQYAPKEGVDIDKAMRAVRSIMVSYLPRHEHKTAACAFLFSEWFSDWRKVEKDLGGPMVVE